MDPSTTVIVSGTSKLDNSAIIRYWDLWSVVESNTWNRKSTIECDLIYVSCVQYNEIICVTISRLETTSVKILGAGIATCNCAVYVTTKHILYKQLTGYNQRSTAQPSSW